MSRNHYINISSSPYFFEQCAQVGMVIPVKTEQKLNNPQDYMGIGWISSISGLIIEANSLINGTARDKWNLLKSFGYIFIYVRRYQWRHNDLNKSSNKHIFDAGQMDGGLYLFVYHAKI